MFLQRQRFLFAGICNFYLIAAILIVGVERIVPDLQVPFCDRVEGLFLGVINYGFVYKLIFNGSQDFPDTIITKMRLHFVGAHNAPSPVNGSGGAVHVGI